VIATAFAVSQGLDIANRGLAKESPVLATELARAFAADLERRTCRIQFTREYALPRGMQAELLLKLQRTHRRKGAKMKVQRRSTHACKASYVFGQSRFLLTSLELPARRVGRTRSLSSCESVDQGG
jgi:hypothetical protein